MNRETAVRLVVLLLLILAIGAVAPAAAEAVFHAAETAREARL